MPAMLWSREPRSASTRQLTVARSLANNLSSESRDRALAMLQDLWNARSEGRAAGSGARDAGRVRSPSS